MTYGSDLFPGFDRFLQDNPVDGKLSRPEKT